MSEYFKLPDFNPDLLDIAMVKSYVSSMKQEYISYWQNTLQHSQKLEFYRSFKTDHTSSSYLDLTRGTAGRRALVKLRISNHKLMIEIGRYNQTTKDNRHCPFCGCNVIEDEVHFLFQCPTYSMIRNIFYYKVKTLIPDITELPINGLINELMNSSNYLETKKNLSKQKQTRVDGALDTVYAYRVIFENGEPARNGVYGQQNCMC